ncbi:Nef protein [SIV-wrc Pbt-05GM-X02]|uniref:Protein Nef n=1 Tax=SIV-wrc Pbt-05GM-X02 TaxID=498715 RepID=B3CKG6_SIV|nr:Nef protein [SIV-wrc Pbt-05GM-X02]
MGGVFSKDSVEQRMLRYRRRLLRVGRKERRRRYTRLAAERQAEAAASGELLPDSAQTLIRAEEDSSKEDSSDDDAIGFPVRPQVPLRQATFKILVDLSHLFKEKGGLEDIFWSPRREEIVNLYAYHEWGIVEGWQAYTDGPGVRYPKTFGWCWKLVPVHFSEESPNSDQGFEKNLLLHPAVAESEDPWKEYLVWKFDPRLACDFVAGRLADGQIATGIETLYEMKKRNNK